MINTTRTTKVSKVRDETKIVLCSWGCGKNIHEEDPNSNGFRDLWDREKVSATGTLGMCTV